MQKTFYSNGKLLLTAEYLVLDGALALAIPTKKGQRLNIETSQTAGITWKSFDYEGNIWLDVHFEYSDLKEFEIDTVPQDAKGRLLQLLSEAQRLNPHFLIENPPTTVKTFLDFPRDWGLGSSSTLINNIAQWAGVDAFELSKKTFGGSGYDIACAKNTTPILYHIHNGKSKTLHINFNPEFLDDVFFVHLNQKQNSRDAIAHYRKQPKENINRCIEKVSGLTNAILETETLSAFELLIDTHEIVLSKVLGIPPIKSKLFADYQGSIKSLGGWGGDFILATGTQSQQDYFRKKGFETIVSYNEMIL